MPTRLEPTAKPFLVKRIEKESASSRNRLGRGAPALTGCAANNHVLSDSEHLHNEQYCGKHGDDAYGDPDKHLRYTTGLKFAHDALIGRNQRHEHQQHRQHQAVDELRHEHDAHEVDVRDEHDDGRELPPNRRPRR